MLMSIAPHNGTLEASTTGCEASPGARLEGPGTTRITPGVFRHHSNPTPSASSTRRA